MKVITTTTYEWWASNKGKIRDSHAEELKTEAENHISEMIGSGYVEGTLSTEMQDDNDHCVTYHGYWTTKTEVPA